MSKVNNKPIISPLKRDRHVEKLLDLVDSEFEEEIVDVIPIDGAIENDCFGNVDLKISLSGGRKHYGWVIWKSGILYEAEFHAVWESEKGDLIDVSPHLPRCEKIMYVPIQDFEYYGQRVDNKRVNYTNNSLVDDFIKLCETIEKIYSFGKREDNLEVHFRIEMSPLIQELATWKDGLLNFIYRKGKKNKFCFCGSPDIYNKCHGKQIDKRLENYLTTAEEIIKK